MPRCCTSPASPALGDAPAKALEQAVAVAREAGVTMSFDVYHLSTLWSDAEAAPVLRALAGAADVVFAGDDEAGLVLGTGTADSAELASGLADLGGPRRW